ncbi:MAG TPA: hypothetical protein VHU83_06885 [Bryobacteraceae bacterium]|nr:hypothetical protein [Bryobacteraceae bacterium]
MMLTSISSTPMLEEPGRRLRRLRERLQLRYRDVEEASQRIAGRHSNDEFLIGLSRLADIENKGTVPSIYRLYSLCAIYGLDFTTALGWYGIDLNRLTVDAAGLPLGETRPVDFRDTYTPQLEAAQEATAAIDLRDTSTLARFTQRCGKLPLALLDSLDARHLRYAFVGNEDWAMFPMIPPGSFIQIDESKRRLAKDGWLHEYERPIYFVEHRSGFRCGWCTEKRGFLIVQPHPLSHLQIEIYRYPGEAEIIGQVVGLAMRLDSGSRRRTRS